ncbi:MAG TPA: homocysteine S-methyltransferase family protein [Actinomycetes bacterium]|nr:homocysteine S-methyltransferase family protein [Actinomycetes bacterium]
MKPQELLSEPMVLTDAGVETVLVFQKGVDLPAFAAFPLVEQDEGRAHLTSYTQDFVELADRHDASLILETPTWRANPDWGAELGYTRDDLRRVTHESVKMTQDARDARTSSATTLISGAIGPRGDGYVPGKTMSAQEAADFHSQQIGDFVDAGVDLVTSFTFTYPEEGIGVATAAAERGVPAVIGFTVETDGQLPNGVSLGEAIAAVDEAAGSSVAWYMINCAHPDHITAGLPTSDEPWMARIGALRANASRQSHAELDEAEVLDDGNPTELGSQYVELRHRFPNLRVVGGCCGTDIRHVEAVAEAWTL